MNQFQIILGSVVLVSLGALLGYWSRQTLARKRAGTIEAKLVKKVQRAKEESAQIINEAREKARRALEKVRQEIEAKREEILKTEQMLLKRSTALDEKLTNVEFKERNLQVKIEKIKEIKENIENLRQQAEKKLEKIAGFSKEEALNELYRTLERERQREILEKIKKLENAGWKQFDKKAKELLAIAIQRVAVSQAQELTTTVVALPDDEIKGRIIGREGRNIRTLEKITGVEILVDDTPEIVVISAYDPIRREVAKIALQKLIRDGRIQPARIEEEVKRAQEQIDEQMREAGEAAVFETGIVALDPRLVKLLGRLRFRTSYGQNVLLHSIEVALLAGGLAAELGSNIEVAKKAGLLHDIGKAVDHQIEGSHVAIGIRILEKFGVEPEIITAMKSHHEEYPAESLEAVIVTVADAISGARPGARKDTLDNYLKRIEELERLSQSFEGVEKAWALQAGREIRIFVKPEKIDDFAVHKLAKEVASHIQQELKYPGEIKVTVIREMRVVEYAK